MSTCSEEKYIKQLRKELKATRRFPENTTPASRHLELIADTLSRGMTYQMLNEEPTHCAITMYAVLIGYYQAKNSETRSL